MIVAPSGVIGISGFCFFFDVLGGRVGGAAGGISEAEDDGSEAWVDIAPALGDAPDATDWGMKLMDVCRPSMAGKLWMLAEAPEDMGGEVRVVANDEVGNEGGPGG